MADSVNMSLDEIIQKNQQNRVSRSRGRGVANRGRGGGRGRGRGRGANGRGQSQSRSGTPSGRQNQIQLRGPRGLSQSRGPRGRSQSQTRSRSQSRTRSRSRQQRRSNSRARSGSRSRSQLRGLTPKGRAGLEDQLSGMPQLVRNGRSFRGGYKNRMQRGNSNQNYQASVHSRLGVTTRRGAANLHRPLAVAKRGISKRGRGISTGNRFSNVGLRSDQILMERRNNMRLQNNIIKSQTFTRSRNNSFNAASQLTVSVANDFAKKRRNSVGNAGYLNKQSLAQLNTQFGYRTRNGPGSVRSMGSNRSNRSYRSNRSNRSIQSNNSRGSRGSTRSRGRGRGGNRGVGRKFVKQILNIKLQKEIAAIQGKVYGNNSAVESSNGINFAPTPAATTQTLHQRFAS